MTTMVQLRTIIDIWTEGAKAVAFEELLKLPLADKVVDWAKLDNPFIQNSMEALASYQLDIDNRGVLINTPYGRFWLVAVGGTSSKYPAFTPEELHTFFNDFVELIVRDGKPPF